MIPGNAFTMVGYSTNDIGASNYLDFRKYTFELKMDPLNAEHARWLHFLDSMAAIYRECGSTMYKFSVHRNFTEWREMSHFERVCAFRRSLGSLLLHRDEDMPRVEAIFKYFQLHDVMCYLDGWERNEEGRESVGDTPEPAVVRGRLRVLWNRKDVTLGQSCTSALMAPGSRFMEVMSRNYYVSPEEMRSSFWSKMEAAIVSAMDEKAELEDYTHLTRLADNLRPHQIRNMVRLVAKETLNLRYTDLMTHGVWATSSGRVLPYTSFMNLAYQEEGSTAEITTLSVIPTLLSSASDSASTSACVNNVFSIILDDVGSGKTRSALSVVFANGFRGGNPHGIDLSEARRLVDEMPWRFTIPWKMTGTQPFGSITRQISKCLISSDHLARLSCRSMLAADGGTLIIVPHNMVTHWEKEIRDLWQLHGTDPRVGVVGKGRLSTKRPALVSPAELARDFDIVLVPNTLTSYWSPAPQHLCRKVLVKKDDRLWSASEMRFNDGRQYMFIGQPEGASVHYLFLVTSPFMRRFFDIQTRTLQVLPTFLPSAHLTIYDGIPEVVMGTFDGSLDAATTTDVVMRNTINRLPSDRVLLKHIVVPEYMPSESALASLYPWEYTAAVAAAHTQGGGGGSSAHPLSLEDPLPILEAVVHVSWYRLIVDEFHLYGNPNTSKRKFVEHIHHASFIGLTAQKEIISYPNATSMRWFADRFWYMMRGATGVGDNLNHAAFQVNSIQNAIQLQCRPTIREPLFAGTTPASSFSALTDSIIDRFIAALDARRLNVQDVGIVLSHLALAIKHILRQIAFGEPVPSIDVVFVSITNTLDNLQRQHRTQLRADQPPTTSQASLTLHSNPADALDSSQVTSISCPICFDEISHQDLRGAFGQWVASLPCKHTLCTDCYGDMTRQRQLHKRCSMCRTPVSKYVYIKDAAEAHAPAAEAVSQGPAPAAAPAAVSQGPASAAAPAPAAVSQGPASAASTSSSKIDLLLSLLLQLSSDPSFRGAVIFCESSDAQMVALMAAVHAVSSTPLFETHSILSNFTQSRRNAVLDRVCRPGGGGGDLPRLLFVRYRMCAVGLNLIFANHVILFNMPHRADYLHQSVGRLCRMGQVSSSIPVWPILFENSFEHMLWSRWKNTLANGTGRGRLESMAAIVKEMVLGREMQRSTTIRI
jgi:hypothetical protein